MNKYTVSIFDGNYTTVYTTEDSNIFSAENKIVKYHMALGGKVIKIHTVEKRG